MAPRDLSMHPCRSSPDRTREPALRSSLIVASDFQSPAAMASRRGEKHQAPGGVAKTTHTNIDSSRPGWRLRARRESAAADSARNEGETSHATSSDDGLDLGPSSRRLLA